MTGTVICDLDGVVYRGGVGIPGAGEALRRLEDDGWRILFCTNNSTRTKQAVARRIGELSGYPATAGQVVGSAEAASTLLAPERPPTYVLGGDGIREALATAGIPEVPDATRAGAVVVGLATDCDYPTLAAAAGAVRRGARLVATNTDPTYPAADGLRPGAGAIVAAVETAAERRAEVAGKPYEPIRRLLRERVGDGAVWVVGDREDTDLELARAEEWKAALVLTGATTSADELTAEADLVLDSLADLPAHIG